MISTILATGTMLKEDSIARERKFTNSTDFSKKLVINIYKEEKEIAKDNTFLKRFVLLIILVEQGTLNIYITIKVSTDGRVTITATKDRDDGKFKELKISRLGS